MSITLNDKPALILIDIQKGFDDLKYWGGGRNNPEAEEKSAEILKFWRENNLPIFHTKHCSSDPNSLLAENNDGNKFKEIVKPIYGEHIIKKNVNSAFIGTNLKQQLQDVNISKLVFVGLTTDHCVSTTIRMAANFGFEVIAVNDAIATFDKIGFDGKKYPAQIIHDTALASLNGEFATILNTSYLLKLLSRS
jgi:nicotinamidase-related amidase